MTKLKEPARRKRKMFRDTNYATQKHRLCAIRKRVFGRVQWRTHTHVIGKSNVFQNIKELQRLMTSVDDFEKLLEVVHRTLDAGAKKRINTRPESYKTKSTLLSVELEHNGYNDVSRDTTKYLMKTLDECSNVFEKALNEENPRCYIRVGSQIERTALYDSDDDNLFGPSAENVAAINDIHDVVDIRKNILMVKHENSPPGHVWLKWLSSSLYCFSKEEMLQFEVFNRCIIQYYLFGQFYICWEEVPDVDKNCLCTWPGTLFIEDRNLQFYIPNSLYTLIGKQMWAGKASRTGPSFSCNTSDVVRPIFCDNIYPKDQDPFVIGGKLYGNLRVPQEYPCNLVSVGHPESEDSMFEWRISYSLTEREIMFGLNITHIQTYVVLKMLQRRFFKQFVGEGFTSFHCKTALFFTVASTQPNFWVKSNLINCVRQCLKMIRIFAKNKFCPHFFNKTFNLFSGKFPRCGKHWDILIDLAIYLQVNTDTYFRSLRTKYGNDLEIKKLSSGAKRFVLTCIVVIEQVNKRVVYGYDMPGDLTPDVTPVAIRRTRVQYKTLQGRMKKLIDESKTSHQRECAEIVLSFVKVRHYLLSAAYLLEQGRKLSPVVSDNLLPDALSMELQMSSLTFACCKFEISRTFLDRVFVKLVNDPIFCVRRYDHMKFVPHNDYLEFINRYRGPYPMTEIPAWTFIKRHVSLEVMFHVHELSLLHPLLRFEAYRFLFEDKRNMCSVDDKWWCVACFDSIPFLFFMQYLVYKELGLEEQKNEAHLRLEVCIDYSSMSYRHIAMNMAGIVCELEWNYDKAFRYYASSLRMLPRFNAAKFHIALLVWKLLDTKRSG